MWGEGTITVENTAELFLQNRINISYTSKSQSKVKREAIAKYDFAYLGMKHLDTLNKSVPSSYMPIFPTAVTGATARPKLCKLSK